MMAKSRGVVHVDSKGANFLLKSFHFLVLLACWSMFLRSKKAGNLCFPGFCNMVILF